MIARRTTDQAEIDFLIAEFLERQSGGNQSALAAFVLDLDGKLCVFQRLRNVAAKMILREPGHG